jgi:5'-deoxynucleotidase YfbR-like HD superfamily hydrolase
MNTQKNLDIDNVNTAHDYLMKLGDVTILLSEVKRAPRYPSGKRETDVDHSFHLALSATELASIYFPDLDLGLVAQFSIIHDLPEIYTGDTWTFNITDKELREKSEAEKEAVKKLIKELPPYTAQLLTRYEDQVEPESRFVRFVDKLLPSVINILAGEANTFKEDYEITNLEDVNKIADERLMRLQRMFPEFPFIHAVHISLSSASHNHMFPRR